MFPAIGMKKVVRQVLGIDVAQKELVVCFGKVYNDLERDISGSKAFANTPKGFELLLKWIKKHADESIAIRFVMEATGIYHEAFAYFLDERGEEVSIVLPNKISNYMRTLNVKTVTDKTASEAIAQFGLDRKLDQWKRPEQIYRTLKQLTRERDQLVLERTALKNQMHAEESEALPNKGSLSRLKERIKLINKQEKSIKEEIKAAIDQDAEAKNRFELLLTIPGVGILTAAIILGETNGFELIRNKRQLASYAGFDVKQKESGTSVRMKPRISKKGNRHLRKAFHLPALCAIKHDERFKAIYARLVAKDGIKMKAVVAVQRKLLEMAYTVYKTNQKYDKDYIRHDGVEEEEISRNKSGKQSEMMLP
jgi:transposase